MTLVERDTLRAAGFIVGSLPPALRLALMVVALLVSMAGCMVGWVDYRTDYVPSPNICRVDEVSTPARPCEVHR